MCRGQRCISKATCAPVAPVGPVGPVFPVAPEVPVKPVPPVPPALAQAAILVTDSGVAIPHAVRGLKVRSIVTV